MTHLLSLAAVLGLAAVAGAAPLADEKSAPASVSFPGGLASADGKRAFVTNVEGGIDALDLETGKVLWSSKDAGRPLALGEKLLLAQATVKPNTVRVVGLDDSGKKVFESEPIAFPDWVSVGVTYGRSFASMARVQNGSLWLRWQARAWYAGGARPTPETEKAARKNDEGAVRVNLKSARVEMLTADRMPAEPGPKVSDEVARAATRTYPDGFGPQKEVRTVGKLAVAIDQDGNKLTLRRWELASGKALDPLPLLEAPAFSWQMTSEHLLAHKALARTSLPEGDYAWWVFDLATGKEVAKLPYQPGTESATVLGPRAYYVVIGARGPRDRSQPRTLHALDLKSGKVIWEHKVEPRPILLPRP
jgi:hypothetical protein